MEKTLNILILEDVETDADLVVRELKRDDLVFESKRVETREEFIYAIRNHRYDIILSDHSLPQFNSMEALKICRRLGLLVPFILITGTVSEEFAVICLKLGADDYILKSNLSRLPSAVMSAINNRKLQEQRIKDELELRYRNEELTKINQELDSFVYSVSHNLRAPLMSVLGLVNIAKQEDVQRDGRLSEYFNMINSSITKLDDTLKEILDYSRNTRKEIEYKKTDIENLIKNCLAELEYLPQFSHIRISFNYTNGHTFITDEHRLKVILRNIFSNAIKYMDEKKEEHTLSITATIEKEETKIFIEDNGTGIRNEILPKVTNMFYRGTDKSQGAGLGLYIAQESIQKMGGNLSIESEYGVRTLVKITIPNHKHTNVSMTYNPFIYHNGVHS